MRTAGVFAVTAVLTATAACGTDSGAAQGGGSPGGSAAPGKTGVTAAMYPLQWLTERVGGPDVAVTGLTEPGVEPHDLELTPVQVAGLEKTRLIVYIKGVQPAVDEAVEQHAADRGFDAATAVTTLPASEEGHDEHGAEEAAHEGEEEHGHEGEEEHTHDVDYDPHIWLDPARFATVATQLGEKLAAADPAHAQGYKDRAAATAAELNTLDGELAKGLGTCASDAIVTSHAAFGYLANRYKLHQIGISGIDPDAEPSPARLAEVAKIAKEEKVTTIFTETLVSPKVAEVLAQEVGAKTAVLDPVESKPANGDYLSAMRQNLTALKAALSCS
ncbi:zinc transport system substrate-binding protein [Streptosporangium becharense]|uniref:Zinc transport system substrate-binding protein n=1 Tax=Streptosporangium becharense TaxID=1816182 RepID=A0A7W9MF51_9ACTN|nr:metal ABC transporter substrate-binding protein [Streptosporangium becharense]MBB2912120.1 zinc transport system substrate-binding protein [Streptosporangium becharense]MBB5818667.1 zinc transport system substrate-binding protein [Streptosporangium becharense]